MAPSVRPARPGVKFGAEPYGAMRCWCDAIIVHEPRERHHPKAPRRLIRLLSFAA
jgi:hypothetical protein